VVNEILHHLSPLNSKRGGGRDKRLQEPRKKKPGERTAKKKERPKKFLTEYEKVSVVRAHVKWTRRKDGKTREH